MRHSVDIKPPRRARPPALSVAVVLGVFVALAGCGGSKSEPSASASPSQKSVEVKLAKVVQKEFGEKLQVYGEVVPAPAGTETLSAKAQAVVDSVEVRVGQHVEAGQALVTLRPSPEMALSVDQARANVAQEKKKLAAAKRQRKLHLATNQDVASAEQSYQQAKLELQSLQSRGGTHPTTLQASHPGVVASVSAEDGALVAAGQPLVTVSRRGDVELSVGVEPEDIAHVRQGSSVTFATLDTPHERHQGQIRAVSGVVRPDTRLVPVYVSVPANVTLLVGQPVEAVVPVKVHQALVVPRSAVLPTDDHMKVFTVDQGKAVAHQVQIGLENDTEVEIVSGDLAAGDSVVVVGNYELEDGMKVRTAGTP